MSKSNFKWDDDALIPESFTINYPKSFKADGSVSKTEGVTHYELGRTELVTFIATAMDKNFVIETKDADGNVTGRDRVPFNLVECEQRDLFFEYLAKSTRGKKDAAFFNELDLGSKAMGALVEMFWKLNHLEEVISTGGNWLLLPQIRRVSEMDAAAESQSQKPILEA